MEIWRRGHMAKVSVHGGSQPRPEMWYKCKEGVGKKHSNPRSDTFGSQRTKEPRWCSPKEGRVSWASRGAKKGWEWIWKPALQLLHFLKFYLFIYFYLFFNFFKFYFIFKLYNIVLVLPNIEMNLPQVYMCFPSWTPLPTPSPYHPSGWSYIWNLQRW